VYVVKLVCLPCSGSGVDWGESILVHVVKLVCLPCSGSEVGSILVHVHMW
jgi:hypothetical protein